MRTRVKICCISSVAEARAAVAAGADAIGLVSAMPSGPGVIDEDLIAVIAAAAPPAIGTVLLTSEVEPASIIAQQRRCGVNTIQLCDALDATAYPVLREALPGIALIQVIHVRGEGAVAEAIGLCDGRSMRRDPPGSASISARARVPALDPGSAPSWARSPAADAPVPRIPARLCRRRLDPVREALPGIALIQVIHVRGEGATWRRPRLGWLP